MDPSVNRKLSAGGGSVCAVEVATRGARGAPGPDRAPGKRRQAARTRDDSPRRRGTVHTTIAYNGITIFSP